MVPVNNKITINKQKGTHIMVSANNKLTTANNKLTTTNNIIVLNTQKETNKKKQSIKNKRKLTLWCQAICLAGGLDVTL